MDRNLKGSDNLIKVFISQPMAGKSAEEILNERNRIINLVNQKYGHCHILDSYFDDFEVDKSVNKPLAYLAESIELLAYADVAVFAHGWDKARGCAIEHECAVKYGIETVELDA